jgi:hypothetical protein
MSLEPRIGPSGRDDDLTRALRELYAPPSHEGYWPALAERIMARVGREKEHEAWWQPLASWARVGVVAAALAVTAAGILMTRTRQAQTRIAYEMMMIDTPQIAAHHGDDFDRDATLLYVISP